MCKKGLMSVTGGTQEVLLEELTKELTLSTACSAAPWPPTPQPMMTRS